MTVAVVLLTVVVAVLAVLVAGLLRSHALVLRTLHDAGIDLDRLGAGGVAPDGRPVLPQAPARQTATGAGDPPADQRTPRPADGPVGRLAADVAGATPDGGAAAVPVVGRDHDTVLLFLSSDCTTCQRFWATLRPGAADAPTLPADTRLVVVTKGPEHESPAAVAAHGAAATVVLSDAAWADYAVPGSPYAVHVDGASGRVVGEGTGASWPQVAELLARATGDASWVGAAPAAGRARRDALAEQDTDAALLAAGILPGDARLYERADGTRVDPGATR